jgi:chorismate synthase
MIRILTAGESHGKGLMVILEGFPANLPLLAVEIDRELARRQMGYGRGGRMKIETDRVEIISGVRKGVTLGGPITLAVWNKDYENWTNVMCPEPGPDSGRLLTRPRPGHADLGGGIKYAQHDLRNILERASARETAMRVAAGAVAKKLLSLFGMRVQSHVVRLGPVAAKAVSSFRPDLNTRADCSPVRMLDKNAEKKAIRVIDRSSAQGDTLGGVFEVVGTGFPAGLGSHVQWDRKLDGRLAQALMSIQAVKGVEFGMGFENATLPGSLVHDEIAWSRSRGFYHHSNHAGGVEGGMTNGEPIVIRVAKKPIATLKKPLRSVDVITKKLQKAGYERSDVCAVPAAAVIGEAVCAWVLADSFLEKAGGDHLEEIQDHWKATLRLQEKY